MKKTLLTLILMFITAVLVVGSASAQTGKIYIKGEVISVGDGTLIVNSYKGQTFVVTVPSDLDIASIAVGDLVLVKGTLGQSGLNLIAATFLTRAAAGDNDGLPEGSKDNSAYCASDVDPHPLVAIMSERYDVAEENVSQYFCNGYSIAAIMMALKTTEIDGVNLGWSDMLALLADGYSWGQIWEQIGLIDNEVDGLSPTGLLTSPEQIPPGLFKKPGQIPPGLLDKPDPGGKKDKDK
jgi:hypothetical protein